ncbi:ABC transporter permease [Mycoplasmatota bacterium WC44]
MSRKQRFLIEFSFMKKVMRKSFLISNIVFLLLIVVVTNLDTIIKSFGGDFTEEYTVYYQDDFDQSYFETFEAILTNNTKDLDNTFELMNEVKTLTETDDNVIVVNLLSGDDVHAEILSNDFVSTSLYSAIYSSLNTIRLDIVSKELDLSAEDIMNLSKSIEIDRVVVNEGENANEFTNVAAEGLSFIVVIPLFFGLIMIIQMIGLEIFDEKSTKSMEILMSNVDPKTHLNAKLIAVNLFSIAQFVLILIYGFIGLGVRMLFSKLPFASQELPFDLSFSDYADKMIITVIFIIILYILTNILYSLVMAILSSTANEVEDYQKIIAPLMIMMLIGFYTAIFSPMFDGAVFSKIMAYIPFFSLMIAPGLFIGGDASIIEMISIIFVLIVSVFLIYRIGLPIYKQSVLDYSTENVFKRFIINFKKSKNK